MSNNTILILLTIFLLLCIIVQIARSLDFMSEIKGRKQEEYKSYAINAFLCLLFLVFGLAAVYWCNELLAGKILKYSASVEGEEIDFLNYLTIVITGIVFVATQVLLFWFAFRYRARPNRKAYYYSHNNKLEIIWTTIPAIAMFILVALGLKFWFKITDDPPQNSQKVEVIGKQFEWIVRYPGKDGILGKTYYKYINDADNRLGQIWTDKANRDDIVVSGEMRLVVDKPALIVVGARDVLHDVGLPHFRLKVDAVPGTPTSMYFTPQYTTKEMRKMLNDPDFDYVVACDQMCGTGHYSMKGKVIVETQEEHDFWLASQKPYYVLTHPSEEDNIEVEQEVKIEIKNISSTLASK